MYHHRRHLSGRRRRSERRRRGEERRKPKAATAFSRRWKVRATELGFRDEPRWAVSAETGVGRVGSPVGHMQVESGSIKRAGSGLRCANHRTRWLKTTHPHLPYAFRLSQNLTGVTTVYEPVTILSNLELKLNRKPLI